MSMRRRHLIAAGLAAPGIVVSDRARAQSYRPEYKLSTVVGTQFPWGAAGQRWADLVKDRTAGRINIRLYPGVSLVGGDQSREFTAIRQGVIDLAIGSTINWSPQIRELNLFALPFLMPDHAAIDALTRGEVGTAMLAQVERREVVPLAWGENGFRELSNRVRPVAQPADMRGLKIRFAVSPIFGETLTALGANPTQMSWADAQPAMATGAIDGQENPLAVFVGARIHTLGQKYVTLWGYVADPLIFVSNRDVWATWTEADREHVRAAAVQAGQENLVAARAGITRADPSLINRLRGEGVEFTELTDAQRDAFRAATRPVYERWSAQIGADLVRRAEAAVAARPRA
jgi:tripartite ATP-independent transporter DctP family solute receptor